MFTDVKCDGLNVIFLWYHDCNIAVCLLTVRVTVYR